jgi:predicted GIY-YIG superfamily endonuclease
MPRTKKNAGRLVGNGSSGHHPERFADTLPSEPDVHTPDELFDAVLHLQRFLIDEHRTGPDKPTSVYLMFDQHGACLYVGITKVAPNRFVQHAADKPWYQDIAETRFEHYRTRITAARREAWLIAKLNPEHNKARPSPFGDSGTEALLWDRTDPLTAPWPLVRGYRLPLTADERFCTAAIHPGPLPLRYDMACRDDQRFLLLRARRAGRVAAAARTIARRMHDTQDAVLLSEVYGLVDDYPFVVRAGVLELTQPDGPAVLVGGHALVERRRRMEVTGV